MAKWDRLSTKKGHQEGGYTHRTNEESEKESPNTIDEHIQSPS
jgi:hypothetical protein